MGHEGLRKGDQCLTTERCLPNTTRTGVRQHVPVSITIQPFKPISALYELSMSRCPLLKSAAGSSCADAKTTCRRFQEWTATHRKLIKGAYRFKGLSAHLHVLQR